MLIDDNNNIRTVYYDSLEYNKFKTITKEHIEYCESNTDNNNDEAYTFILESSFISKAIKDQNEMHHIN